MKRSILPPFVPLRHPDCHLILLRYRYSHQGIDEIATRRKELEDADKAVEEAEIEVAMVKAQAGLATEHTLAAIKDMRVELNIAESAIAAFARDKEEVKLMKYGRDMYGETKGPDGDTLVADEVVEARVAAAVESAVEEAEVEADLRVNAALAALIEVHVEERDDAIAVALAAAVDKELAKKERARASAKGVQDDVGDEGTVVGKPKGSQRRDVIKLRAPVQAPSVGYHLSAMRAVTTKAGETAEELPRGTSILLNSSEEEKRRLKRIANFNGNLEKVQIKSGEGKAGKEGYIKATIDVEVVKSQKRLLLELLADRRALEKEVLCVASARDAALLAVRTKRHLQSQIGTGQSSSLDSTYTTRDIAGAISTRAPSGYRGLKFQETITQVQHAMLSVDQPENKDNNKSCVRESLAGVELEVNHASAELNCTKVEAVAAVAVTGVIINELGLATTGAEQAESSKRDLRRLKETAESRASAAVEVPVVEIASVPASACVTEMETQQRDVPTEMEVQQRDLHRRLVERVEETTTAKEPMNISVAEVLEQATVPARINTKSEVKADAKAKGGSLFHRVFFF